MKALSAAARRHAFDGAASLTFPKPSRIPNFCLGVQNFRLKGSWSLGLVGSRVDEVDTAFRGVVAESWLN